MDPTDVLSRAAEAPDAVVRYAHHNDGLIDVFLPPSLGHPHPRARLLTLIHGGFWRHEYDRMHVRPMANALTRKGFVVAVPEYRRTGGAGGWPTTGDDVAAALAAIPQLVDEVTPGRVAIAAPLVLTGHSAGGHLALWSGLRAEPGRVSHIVALAPVADLYGAAAANLDGGAAQDLLGGDPADRTQSYADADPLAVMTAASPPVTVVHGTADRHVPVDMSRDVATRHPQITYIEREGVDHFALIDPLSSVFSSTVLPLLKQGS